MQKAAATPGPGLGVVLALHDWMLKVFLVGAAVIVLALHARTAAAREIQPGDALDPEELSPEARAFESALEESPVDATGHSVVERRRFDADWGGVGIGTGLGMPGALIGAYAELTPWERTTLGAELGLNFWGPAGGAYFRLRPIIWGGDGRKLLNAFVLQASYTLMRDGPIDLMPCIDACSEAPLYQVRTAQAGALSAGFEHQFASGWSLRYDFGVGRVLSATTWSCKSFQDGSATPCTTSPPSDTLPLLSFSIGHTL